MHKTERMPAFKITWAHISSRDTRFIVSLQVAAVVWPVLPDRDTFRWCFELSFHNQMAASKLTLSRKRMYADTPLSKYTMEPVYISKPYFEYMVQCEFHDVMAHITECVLNGLNMCVS